MSAFITLRVRNTLVHHGYTADGQEIVETIAGEPFAEKLIAIDRIQSATERTLLVSAPHGRALYWEYEGGLAALTERLAAAGHVVA